MKVLYLSRLDVLEGKYSFDNILRLLFREMLVADPEMSLSITVSQGAEPDGFVEEIGAPDRVRVVRCLPDRGDRTLSYLATEDVALELSQLRTPVPYDVVVCGQPGMASAYWGATANRYKGGAFQVTTPFVSHLMWVTTQAMMGVGELKTMGDRMIVADAMGAWFGHVLFESDVLRDEFMRTMRQWVQPSVLRKLLSDSAVVNNGVDVVALEPVWQRRVDRMRSGGGPGAFWAARLSEQKQWHRSAVALNVLASRGFRAAATTNFPDVNEKVLSWREKLAPAVPLETGIDRAGLYERMAEFDVVVCHSKVESYGAGWLEMLAAGMLVVFKDEPWCRALLPDWYPLFGRSDGEVTELAMMALKQWPNGDLWTELVPRVREWMVECHDYRVSGRKLGEELRRASESGIAEDAKIGLSAIGRLATDAAESLWDGEPLEFDEIVWRMTKLGRSDREFGGRGDLITRMFLRRALQVNGWVDVGDASSVRMVKRA